jgi:hypothetical protein
MYKIAKIHYVMIILSMLTLFGLLGCKTETETTTVMTTVTAPAQTITITSTITPLPQTVMITKTETVISTLKSTTQATSTASKTSTRITQAQEITSDDGKVQIVNHNFVNSSQTGSLDPYVEGAVKNLTDVIVSAEITVKFYSADDSLVSTKVVLVEDIEPGKTESFNVTYSGYRRGVIVYYEIFVKGIS